MIKAGTYTKIRYEENPEFTLYYQGFKNNETEDVLTKKPTVATTATKESLLDTYDVTVSDAEAQYYKMLCHVICRQAGLASIVPGLCRAGLGRKCLLCRSGCHRDV